MTRWGKKEALELLPLMDQPARLIDAIGERASQPMTALSRDSSLSALDWERAKGFWSAKQDYSKPMPDDQRQAIEGALRAAAPSGLFYPEAESATPEALETLARMPATLALCALRDESVLPLAKDRLSNRALLWGAAMATEGVDKAKAPQPAWVDRVFFDSASRLAQAPETLMPRERSEIVASLERRIRAWPLFAQNEKSMGERADELLASAESPNGRLLLAQALVGAFIHGDMDAPRSSRLTERALNALSEAEAARSLGLALLDCPDLLSPHWAGEISAAKRLNAWSLEKEDRPQIFNALEPRMDPETLWPSIRVTQIIHCFGEPPPEAARELATRHFKAGSMEGGVWWLDRAGPDAAADEPLRSALVKALWKTVANEGGWGLAPASPPASIILAKRVGLAERGALWLDQAAKGQGLGGAPQALLDALSSLSPTLGALAEARAIRGEISPSGHSPKSVRALAL